MALPTLSGSIEAITLWPRLETSFFGADEDTGSGVSVDLKLAGRRVYASKTLLWRLTTSAIPFSKSFASFRVSLANTKVFLLFSVCFGLQYTKRNFTPSGVLSARLSHRILAVAIGRSTPTLRSTYLSALDCSCRAPIALKSGLVVSYQAKYYSQYPVESYHSSQVDLPYASL